MKVVRKTHKHFYILSPLLLALPLVCFGQKQNKKSSNDQQQPNGISAGRPKIFDSRALTLMLETLNDQLRNVQVIDQKTLGAALGLQQGFSSTDFTSSLTATTLPVPGLKQETVTKTGNVGSTGNPLPDTTQKTVTSSRDAVVPQAPSLEASAGLPSGYNPSYGESAGDLLSDQVNLSYQIFNLRMLLERSLSDRLLVDNNKPRLQAVLGVNVTLDPPRTANDAVAVVEITVEAADKDQKPDGLSLVALMPQEKTYNAAAVSTKSNSFGGAAVVKMVQVSYNQRKRSQVFYLYRDTDTLAYERTEGNKENKEKIENKNKVVFGWMFRPVLGRRSVSPGLRQMFAILALPAEDGDSVHQLKATVKTYWKKYDRNTITSFKNVDANRAQRFGFHATLGLNKPEIFEHRYENSVDYSEIEVKSTERYEGALRADVDQVYWRPVGAKTALISVKGKNFFTDTKVSMGDKIYASAADGFYLKSTQSFDLTTTLDALVSGPGEVLSRYGRAVPLVVIPPSTLPANGMEILRIETYPVLAGYRTCDIYLKARQPAESLKIADLPSDQVSTGLKLTSLPVVSVNNNAVPPPYTLREAKQKKEDPDVSVVVLQVDVPDSYLVKGGGNLKVSWPFLPADKWTSTWNFTDPAFDFEVIRLSGKSIAINRHNDLGFIKDPETIDGNPKVLPYCWQLLAADTLIELYTSACPEGSKGPLGESDKSGKGKMVSFSMKQDKDTIPDKVILIDPGGEMYTLDVPKAKSDDTSVVKTITLKQYDAQWIEITGDDKLKNAASAEANQVALKVRIPSEATTPTKTDASAKTSPLAKTADSVKIEVEITREVTAKPGDVDLTILDKDGKPVDKVRRRLQVTCVLCGEGGK